jgi:hypothetical protein
MQLKDQIKSVQDMDDDEFRKRLAIIQRNRLQIPARTRVALEAKKKAAKAKLDKLISSMTKEELQELLDSCKIKGEVGI